MPFFEPPKEQPTNIDYSRSQPIAVVAAFNPCGDIKPVHFGIMDLYGNACKVQITGIKYTKPVRGGFSFCCTYLSGNQQRECILSYYIDKHSWVLGN
jgi:hypothetical protein